MSSNIPPPTPFGKGDEGGGCLSIFEVPFTAAGVFTALIGFQIIPVSISNDRHDQRDYPVDPGPDYGRRLGRRDHDRNEEITCRLLMKLTEWNLQI